MGARLMFNTDVFCFASPFFDKPLPPRLLHPRRIFDGVVEGVEHGGKDVAQVASSVYLPDDRGPGLEESRTRLRAGLNWQGESWGVQYGLTYLSEEFEGQPEGQFLGAARIKYNF